MAFCFGKGEEESTEMTSRLQICGHRDGETRDTYSKKIRKIHRKYLKSRPISSSPNIVFLGGY